MRRLRLQPSTIGFLVFFLLSVIFGVFHGQIAYLIDIWGISGKAPMIPEDQFVRLERKGWKVLEATSSETTKEKAPAANALDGNKETFWHSEWGSGKQKLPQHLAIDTGADSMIFAFEYLPRQKGDNGRVKDYRCLLSQDGKTWTLAAQGAFPDNTQTQLVRLQPPRAGRFVRLECVSEVKGRPYAAIAELNVLTVE